MRKKCGNDISRLVLCVIAVILLVSPAMAAPSTQIHVVKYANDGTTVLKETTKTYQEMETSLPVYGDGITHYYHQGPTFDTANLWDARETINVDSRDYGAAKGTDVKDLCDLVGGMNTGEWVKIKAQAPDNFNKNFDYEDVYTPEPEQGKMIISWYNPTFGGYPPAYDTGMRLIFFADPEPGQTKHVFGDWDMHEYLAEDRWAYYWDGILYPSSSQLSVQNVGEIIIYSDDPVPVLSSITVSPATPTVGLGETQQFTASGFDQYNAPFPVTVTWTSSSTAVGTITPVGLFSALTSGTTTITATSGLVSGTTEVTVPQATPVLTSITVSPATPTVAVGETQQFTASGFDQYNAPFPVTVTWTSSSTAVGTITSGGLFSALGSGSTTITATDGSVSGTAAVTVSPAAPVLTSITVTPATAPVSVGNTQQFTASGFDQYNDPFPVTVTWTSSNTAVGTITSTIGLFSALSSGSTTITATDGSVSGTAAVTVDSAPTMDVLYDGPVTLTTGETFTVTGYSTTGVPTTYTVSRTTPLGALDKAATAGGFTYKLSDKNYASGYLLLNDIGTYLYQKTPKKAWYAYVNNVYKDGYVNAADGLNLIELANGDKVEFYYVDGTVADPADLTAVKAAATAAVKTVASTGVTPADWSIVLDGAKTQDVTKTYFEQGLACAASGHQVFWTDGDGKVWGGVPLWLLVAMVDDDPDIGPDHFNLNDDLAAQHYEVKVIGSDGWSAVFDSASVARSSNYLVANTLNGEPLPALTEGGKPSWPLHLKGDSVLGGQQVGSIARIELNNLPQPPEGWTLAMLGQVGDTIPQEEFENGLACPQSGHLVTWTDVSGNVWSGVPLWVLLGAVDDIELADHWTFSDSVAASGYTVKVTAADGFSKTFSGTTLARNNNYIVANKMNGAPLSDSVYPLRLVGSGVTKSDGTLGGSAVGKIAQIGILELQTPPPATGSYNLAVKGKITDVLSQEEIEQGLACPQSGHLVTWTQVIKNADGSVKETHVWSGIPLWFLAGWVDDRQPHEFNGVQAIAGYKITVKAADGYAKDFTSTDIAKSNDYIVATMKDGAPLPEGKWPLQLVGAPLAKADGTLSGTSVSKIAEIELTEFGVPMEIPKVHIIKYGADQQTIVSDVLIDYAEMQQQFDVIGDGVTQYKYQANTMDPTDIWGVTDETKGGFKISNAVKGTRIIDLVSLVGDMGVGTDIVFVANDGYKTILPYTSIHTTPAIQDRQGDAILVWYADGKYVPSYTDGMRLFFMPEDTIYGQWDMHETMPAGYWHYYYQSYSASDPKFGQYAPGILYPSAAGTSAKYVTEIRVYSTPESDWNLILDGTDIGGMEYTVNKAYFEAALACQLGANHDASYTDASGVWSGMPLWFLQGFVDDADQHSNNAYNGALALEGYNIVVSTSDGDSITIDSRNTIRSNGYIVANSLDEYHIKETDSSWPLRLVGDDVSESMTMKGITSIKLVRIMVSGAAMTVTKSASSTLLQESGDVTFTYLVKNIGTLPISNIVLTDDTLGVVSGPPSGDTNDNDVLDPGETWTYSITAIVAETTTGAASATGNTDTPGQQVSAQSNTVTVQVGAIATPEFPSPALPVMLIGAMAIMAFVYRRE